MVHPTRLVSIRLEDSATQPALVLGGWARPATNVRALVLAKVRRK